MRGQGLQHHKPTNLTSKFQDLADPDCPHASQPRQLLDDDSPQDPSPCELCQGWEGCSCTESGSWAASSQLNNAGPEEAPGSSMEAASGLQQAHRYRVSNTVASVLDMSDSPAARQALLCAHTKGPCTRVSWPLVTTIRCIGSTSAAGGLIPHVTEQWQQNSADLLPGSLSLHECCRTFVFQRIGVCADCSMHFRLEGTVVTFSACAAVTYLDSAPFVISSGTE